MAKTFMPAMTKKELAERMGRLQPSELRPESVRDPNLRRFLSRLERSNLLYERDLRDIYAAVGISDEQRHHEWKAAFKRWDARSEKARSEHRKSLIAKGVPSLDSLIATLPRRKKRIVPWT